MRGLSATRGAQLIRHLARGTCTAGTSRCGLHTRAWGMGLGSAGWTLRPQHCTFTMRGLSATRGAQLIRHLARGTCTAGRRGAGCTLGPGAWGLGSAGWTLRPQHCTFTMRGLSATRGAQLIRHLARGTCTAGTSRCGLHTRAWAWGSAVRAGHFGLSLHIRNAWTERYAWRPAHPPPRAWHLHRGDVAVRAAHSGLGLGSAGWTLRPLIAHS